MFSREGVDLVWGRLSPGGYGRAAGDEVGTGTWETAWAGEVTCTEVTTKPEETVKAEARGQRAKRLQ